jgi:hypothetical protein
MIQRLLLMAGLMTVIAGAGLAQEIHVRPVMAYSASVTDRALIQQFMEQQAILSDEPVDSIEVIDATANGFGENDLLMLYPSKQIYPLMTVEEPLKSIMTNWRYNLSQVTSPHVRAAELAQQARNDRNPYVAVLSHVLRGLEKYYSGSQIEGTFRRDQNSSYIALWNFAADSFRYQDTREGGATDTLHYYDLLQITTHDTMFVADSTMYDVIYVYKTYRDTVYVPTPAGQPMNKSQR